MSAEAFFALAVERVRDRSSSALLGTGERARAERELTVALERLCRGLIVEIDAAEGDVCRIVLSPVEDSGLEPILTALLRRAPTHPDVAFIRHRGERDVPAALGEVRERFDVDLSSARARIGFSRGHLLEVVVHSSMFSSTADDRGLDSANLLVRRLVGDELFDDWIGAVDVAPALREGPLKLLSAPEKAPMTLALTDCLPAVEAAVRGLYAELPNEPYRAFSDRAKWTLFEMEPGAELDYAEQDDLALKSTALPEATKCFLEGARFSSRRFSKHGESFAYVKVDASSKSADERHALRVRLEELLVKALLEHAIGCVVGAGLGVRYVYIDVVLENLDRGVELVRATLRGMGVDPRSWILFFDGALSHEWVGVWDDTPPPPSR